MHLPIFQILQRPGTPAEDVQVEEQVKSDRLSALQQLLDAQQMAFNKSSEEQEMDILIERAGGCDGQMTANPFMQSVYLNGDAIDIGKIRRMKIIEGRQNSLLAEAIS